MKYYGAWRTKKHLLLAVKVSSLKMGMIWSWLHKLLSLALVCFAPEVFVLDSQPISRQDPFAAASKMERTRRRTTSTLLMERLNQMWALSMSRIVSLTILTSWLLLRSSSLILQRKRNLGITLCFSICLSSSMAGIKIKAAKTE